MGETRRGILAQTKRKSMCLPCLAKAGTISIFTTSLSIKSFHSHIRRQDSESSRPDVTLLMATDVDLSPGLWSFSSTSLPPGPLQLSCLLTPWVILCPSDSPLRGGIRAVCDPRNSCTEGARLHQMTFKIPCKHRTLIPVQTKE